MKDKDPLARRLVKLRQKLRELRAARRVDDRKWEMRIDAVELEIRRIVEKSRNG